MDIAAMIQQAAEASAPSKPKREVYDTDTAKRTIYATLDDKPASKRELTRKTKLSDYVVSRVLEEMVRCGTAKEEYPGEFGRRKMYVKGR